MPSSTSSSSRWLLACLALVLLAFGSGLAATELLIRTKVEPSDLFEQHLAVYFDAETGNAAFGDSIVAYGFLPETPDFVNLATDGEVPAGTFAKVRAFFADRPAGKVIVAANHNILRRGAAPILDYDSIFGQRERPLLRITQARHRRYAFLYWHSLVFDRFQAKRRILPYGGEVHNDPADNHRFGTKPEAARLEHGRGKALRAMPRVDERSRANREAFTGMLAFLRERGAETCVVAFPMSPAFRQATRDFPVFQETQRWFRDQAERHGAGYLDLRARLDDDGLFWDPVHLAEDGGRLTTREILAQCFE